MDDGMIALGSPDADELGFTADRFDGYLWKHGETIIISLIMARRPARGDFGRFLRRLWAKGYTVQVPTPLGQMLPILQAKGFQQRWEWDEMFQDHVEIWEKGPPKEVEEVMAAGMS